METIITVATILSMYLNAGIDGNSQYFYNADIENGQVTTLYVYDRTTDGLNAKMKYLYTYDEADRLTCKEAMAWNSVSRQWDHNYKLDISYTDEGYELERSLWNAGTQAYKEADQKAVYRFEFDHLLSVNYLKLDRRNDTYNVVKQLLIMNPRDTLLLACE